VPSDLTEDQVVAAQRGDSAALSAVYRAFAPTVTGFLRAKGVSDAEGTTSEVFLAVLPRLAGLTGGRDGLRTLIFSVAHARMVDAQRAHARRGVTESYDPARDPRVSESAEDDALDALATEQVCELLAELPTAQRDALALRVVADLSINEIATITGRSDGAVKQLMHRGLVRLRAALAERQVPR
jgi:RNA polymerase sigma-70 factor (ECF subfamily)